MNILIVDSDRDTVEMLTGWLRARSNAVNFVFTADRIRTAWETHEPDLVILDVSMPGVDVLAICRDLQSQHDALILAVTEQHDTQMQIQCLESGADAYLPKPFSPKQLLAHIHCLGRRIRPALQRQSSTVMVAGPIHFDASRNEVKVEGRSSRLTPTESRILQVLLANAGDVCTLNQIVTHAWGYSDDGDTYLIKAHIRHLREKIEKEPSRPRFIRTVPGVGYSLSTGSAGGSLTTPPNGNGSGPAASRLNAAPSEDDDAEDDNAEDDNAEDDGADDVFTDDSIAGLELDTNDQPFREAL